MGYDDEAETSCEPMEIDRSLNYSSSSTATQGVKMEEKNKSIQSYRRVKKFNVKLSRQERNITTYKVMKAVAIFSVLIAVFCYWLRSACCDKSKLNSVQEILMNRIHGQTNAIVNLVDSFTDNSNSKLIFFYGPTGVGKTYTSQIILQQLQNYSNTLNYAVSSRESFSANTVFIQLHVCSFVFTVVDDMHLDNNESKTTLKDLISMNNSLQSYLYLILIFNTDMISEDFRKTSDKSFREKLERSYRDVPASKYYIEFDVLNEQHLRKCIELALQVHNYKVPRNVIEKLLPQFRVSFDGCKGVDSKIKSLNLEKNN